MSVRSPAASERGAALVMALLITLLLSVIGVTLLTLTSTETLIAGGYRQAQEASYGAEAALERAIHDLAAVPDWSTVLARPSGNAVSTFVDGTLFPRTPDGRTLDLANLTTVRQRESDALDGARVFGADSPSWRLYAHAPLDSLLPAPRASLPIYLVVWVADDGGDGDGDPSRDRNRTVLVRAEAFGGGGARRSVDAVVARADNGAVRLLAWHDVR